MTREDDEEDGADDGAEKGEERQIGGGRDGGVEEGGWGDGQL